MWWNKNNRIFSFWIICLERGTEPAMQSEYSYLELIVVLYCILGWKISLAKVLKQFFSDSKTLFYSFSFLSHLIIATPVIIIIIIIVIGIIKVNIIIFIIIVIIIIVTFITMSSEDRFKTWFLSLAWRRRLVIIRILIGGWMFGAALLSWPVVICLIWFNIIINGLMH